MNLTLTLQYKQIDPGVINLTQYSNNTDVLVFELDNYLYETTDLSACECYAVCDLPQGKIDEIKVTTNKTADGKLQIRWHVMGYSTELDGTVTYQIMFKNASGLIWTSNKAIMFVNSTIDADGHIASEYPSLLTQWETRMGETDEHSQEILKDAKKESDKALKSANDAAKSETNASNSAKASAASANEASTSETNTLAAEERVKELIGYEPTNMIEREVTQARGTYPLLGERLDANDTKVDAKFDKAGGNVTGNIILANTKAIHGKDATGTTRNLIAIGATNAIGVGSSANKMQLVASTVPEWNNGNMVRPLATMDDLKATGWGVSTNQVLTSVTDLNSVRTSGIYSLSSSIDYKNVPPNTNGGILEILAHTPSYLKQFFHTVNKTDTITFMRTCINNSWTDWVQIAITKNLDKYLTLGGGTLTGATYLKNNVALCGKTTDNNYNTLIWVSNTDVIQVGDTKTSMIFRSKTVPEWYDEKSVKKLATIDDINGTGWGVTNNSSNVLAANTNLNIITRAGLYGLRANMKYINVPNGFTDGNLIVLAYAANYTSQIIYGFNGNNVWIRYCNNNTWSSWVRLGTETDLSKYLPLTGGTLNGFIVFHNAKGVYGKNTEGKDKNLISLTGTNVVIIGDFSTPMQLRSSEKPVWHNGTSAVSLATSSDIGTCLPLTGGTMKGDIILPNVRGLYSKTADGTKNTNLINLKTDNKIAIGGASTTEGVDISSKTQPTWWDGTKGKILATKDEVLLLSGGDLTGTISVPYNKSFYVKDSSGVRRNVASISEGNNTLLVGSSAIPINIISSTVPIWNNGATKKELALKDNVLALTGGLITGDIVFNNARGLFSKNSNGATERMLYMSNKNVVQVGNVTRDTQILTPNKPQWNNGSVAKELATTEDITSRYVTFIGEVTLTGRYDTKKFVWEFPSGWNKDNCVIASAMYKEIPKAGDLEWICTPQYISGAGAMTFNTALGKVYDPSTSSFKYGVSFELMHALTAALAYTVNVVLMRID